MRGFINCCLCICKYFTDKILLLLNILILLPCSICLIVKSKNYHVLDDVSWAAFVLPMAGIIAFDIVYCMLCKCARGERGGESGGDSYRSVV